MLWLMFSVLPTENMRCALSDSGESAYNRRLGLIKTSDVNDEMTSTQIITTEDFQLAIKAD